MSAKTLLGVALATTVTVQLAAAQPYDADARGAKVISGEIEYDEEYGYTNHGDDEEEVKPCCDHGQGGQDHDEHVERDPYQDVEEDEHIVEDEVLPLGWWEHLRIPSIKSSRQLRALTEDMIMRPANHIFIYFYTADCFGCY